MAVKMDISRQVITVQKNPPVPSLKISGSVPTLGHKLSSNTKNPELPKASEVYVEGQHCSLPILRK